MERPKSKLRRLTQEDIIAMKEKAKSAPAVKRETAPARSAASAETLAARKERHDQFRGGPQHMLPGKREPLGRPAAVEQGEPAASKAASAERQQGESAASKPEAEHKGEAKHERAEHGGKQRRAQARRRARQARQQGR